MPRYIDGCTPEQAAALFTPDTSPSSPLGRFRAAKAARRNVTMTDILSEIASERAGPVRYECGRLVKVEG